MRKLIDLVSDNTTPPSTSILRTLEEGKKEVMQMFNPLISLIKKHDLSETFQLDRHLEEITNIIKTLKRSDRQVWAARYLRYELVDMIQRSRAVRDTSEEFREELSELRKKYFPYQDNGLKTSYRFGIRQQITNHFLGINYPPIQNYIFKDQSYDQVIDDLTELEKKYKETVSGKLTLRKGDQIVAHVGEYIWVLLDRGYCSEEAEAMGHCGNIGAQSGDRILSLRKFAERLDGVDYYNVYLTFILDSEGRLGEMKGRANEKPAARYHPYIIELLKLPLIKGVKGGGYLPQNNFSLDDLMEEQRDDLFRIRGDLAPYTWRLTRYGLTDDLRKDIISEFKKMDQHTFSDVEFESGQSLSNPRLTIVKFPTTIKMVQELSYKDELAEKAVHYLMGEDDIFPAWEFQPLDEEIRDMIESLNIQQRIKIGEYAKKLVSDNEGEDEAKYFDIASKFQVLTAFELHDKENYSNIKWAVRYGMQASASAQVLEALRYAIKEAQGRIKIGELEADPSDWDAPAKITLSMEEVFRTISSYHALDRWHETYENPANYVDYLWSTESGAINIAVPYYGFTGIDNDYAKNNLMDTLEGVDLDFEKAEEPDFDSWSSEQLKAWIKDFYKKLPKFVKGSEGLVKVYDFDEEIPSRYPQIAKYLFQRYYG